VLGREEEMPATCCEGMQQLAISQKRRGQQLKERLLSTKEKTR